VVHGVVELLDEGVVFLFAVLFGEAERLDALDEDFAGVGLGFEDFDDFGEEVFEGHGARVGGLAAAHEFGLDVGWDEFEDLDAGGLELVTQGLAVGVDGSLCGVVGGCDGHGDEGEAGGDRHDGRVEYELTELGRSLGEAFCGVWIWAEAHGEEIERARAAFKERE
jgi:hypothetical protein